MTESGTTREKTKPSGSPVLLFLGLLLTAAAGVPLVAFLWETINQLLSGHLHIRRILVSIPALLVFAALIRLVGRRLRRLEDAAG
jgi:hypothetical protein